VTPWCLVTWRIDRAAFGARVANEDEFMGKPIHETLIGSVEGLSPEERDEWLVKLGALGRAGH
jgi:hypothetical protein